MIIKSKITKTLLNQFLKTPPLIIILADIILFSLLLITLSLIFPKSNSNSSVEINAQESKETAKQIFDSCFQRKGDECYKEQFTPIVKEKGLKYAEKTVEELQNFDPKIRHCHVLSHGISGIATRLNPKKWKELLDIVDVNICGGGFFHGIIEAHVGYDSSFKIDENSIKEICKLDKQIEFKNRTCSHIFGHLTVLEAQGKMEPGLEICSKLIEIVQKDCYNGVFMEDSFKTSLVEHGLAKIPVRDEKRMIKQQKRCLNYSKIAGESCWIDMAEIFEELYDQDAPTVYKKCNEASFESAVKACYFKAATLMGISRNYNSQEQMTSICPMFTNERDYKTCTSSIISGLMYYSAKFTDRGIMLCNNVPNKYQNYCFSDLGKKLKGIVPESNERQKLCVGANPNYLYLCTGK